ncbi:MAG: metallophosphoesterase family protein [Gaiellaceae bacterium]
MRIAYVVDAHDRFDWVPRALEELGEVDVLVIGGDITTFATPEDAERAIGSWRPLAPLRALVEREQPDLVLCGRIHESRGEDTIGASRVVNPGPVAVGHYAIVDIGEAIRVRRF